MFNICIIDDNKSAFIVVFLFISLEIINVSLQYTQYIHILRVLLILGWNRFRDELQDLQIR